MRLFKIKSFLKIFLFFIFVFVPTFALSNFYVNQENRVRATGNTLTLSFDKTSNLNGTGTPKTFEAVTVKVTASDPINVSSNTGDILNACWKWNYTDNVEIINTSSGLVVCGNQVGTSCSGGHPYICAKTNNLNLAAGGSVTLGSFQFKQKDSTIAMPNPFTLLKDTTEAKQPTGWTANWSSTNFAFQTTTDEKWEIGAGVYTSPTTWPAYKNLNESFNYYWRVVNPDGGARAYVRVTAPGRSPINGNQRYSMSTMSFNENIASLDAAGTWTISIINAKNNDTIMATKTFVVVATTETTASFTSPVPWPETKNIHDYISYHWQVTNSVINDYYVSGYTTNDDSRIYNGGRLQGNGGTIGNDKAQLLYTAGIFHFNIYHIDPNDPQKLTPMLARSQDINVIDPANVHLSFSPAAGSVTLQGTKADPYFTVGVNLNTGTTAVTQFKVCMKFDPKLWFGCGTDRIVTAGLFSVVQNSGDNVNNPFVCWIKNDTSSKIINATIGTVQLHVYQPSANATSFSTYVKFDISTGNLILPFTPSGADVNYTLTFPTAPTLAPGTAPTCQRNTGTATPIATATTPPAVTCPKGDLGNLDCSSDEYIGATDLAILLNAWAPNGPTPTVPAGQHSADLVVNSKVDNDDLNKLLANWSSPPEEYLSVDNGGNNNNYTSSYPRAPAANYVFYEWQNADLNAQHPNGAPWGKVFNIRWDRIQGGMNNFDWQGVDAYLARAATLNTPVMLSISPYEWTMDKSNIPANILDQHPCESDGTIPFGIGTDLTPAFIKNSIGLQYAYMKKAGNEFCVPDPNPKKYSCSLVGISPYNDGLYRQAIKNLAVAMGQKYNNDPKVAGIMIGWGADAEFGNLIGNWGGCDSKVSVMQQIGFNYSKYLDLMTAAGPNNDAGDWFGAALPNKPVYVRVTGGGKAMVPDAMPSWPTNVGLAQASLTPDHNWFTDSAGQGIMDIAMLAAGKRPLEWENAFPGFSGTKQYTYGLFLAMLPTFPDFFDFTGGGCFGANALATCNWAKQYYGRTPQNTNDIWIAFQQTDYPMPSVGGAVRFGGWPRDWEYGLKLTSAKGSSRNKAGLVKLFNQAVADNYSGQARHLNVGQTMTLSPNSDWKGIASDSSSSYQLDITYIGNSGKVKVEVGNATDGWYTEEWDRDSSTPTAWHTKTLSPNKKANIIKISPTSGDGLYLHMVKLTIQ